MTAFERYFHYLGEGIVICEFACLFSSSPGEL